MKFSLRKTFIQAGVAFLGLQPALAFPVDFGSRGQTGKSGANGLTGASGNNLTITAGSSVRTYYRSVGSPGGDGSPGYPGEDAWNCYQPYRPRHDLRGADGGSGGRGGSGGNGGSGGQALIYTSSLEKLKSIILINNGAPGGRGAEGGAYGGRACYCSLQNWHYLQCEWHLMRKPSPDPNGAGWSFAGSEKNDCSDSAYPPPVPSQPGFDFKWDLNKTLTQNYYCTNGRDGTSGQHGPNGSHGSYGMVTIVKGASLPQAKNRYSGPLSASLSNFHAISENVFLSKSGLTRLLHPESVITDSYLEFVRHEVRRVGFSWRLPNGPAYYGLQNSTIAVSLVQPRIDRAETKLSVSLPSDLTHEIEQIDSEHWRVVINDFSGGVPPPPPPASRQCSQHDGKGSVVCEFSGRCVYQDGICLPR